MKTKESSITQLMIHVFANLITVNFGDTSNTEGKIVSATVYAIYRGDDEWLKVLMEYQGTSDFLQLI